MMIVCLLYTYKLNILHTEHIINTLSLVRKLHAWGFVSCGRWAWDVQSSPVRLRNSGCGAQPEHRCQPSRAAGMYAICSMLVPWRHRRSDLFCYRANETHPVDADRPYILGQLRWPLLQGRRWRSDFRRFCSYSLIFLYPLSTFSQYRELMLKKTLPTDWFSISLSP